MNILESMHIINNEKQDVKRYLLYALVLSRIYGTQRVYKTILQFFKKINEED